jgi:signal transduction histidine kinase
VTGWIESFYYFIIGAAMLLTVMGLWFTVIMPCLDRWSRRFFIGYFSMLLLCCVVSLTDLIIARYPDTEAALTVLGFLESLSLSVTIPMLTAYLVRSCGGNVWGSGLFRTALALWLVFLLILASTPFTKYIFYTAPDRQFQRGPWFPLLILPLIVIMLLNLAAAVRARRTLSRRYFFGFLIAILPLTAVVTVHAFTDVTVLIDISTVLSAISMLGLILSDQTERYVEKERENARLRTDIMLSQIQPHFLYNTLGTIGRLYRNDPEAKAALIKFSDYLRGNMDSLSQTEPLPFTTELKHTKTYLELEQLRFRDKLTVCYDLEPTDFLLPVLTLQPLVENAVRHGVRGNDTGAGTVTVATREYPDRYEISVTDDGPGFDPDAEPEGEGAHIGIRNVRDRMRRFVGGDLKIETAPGRGCRATILMPKEIRYADLRH